MMKKQWEKRFDKKFPCIQPDCDGNGNIPVQVGDDEWEADQCQFHAEYLFLMKAFISQEIKDQLARYSMFLLRNGYVDDDVWCEEPAAIDRYLQSKEEEDKCEN